MNCNSLCPSVWVDFRSNQYFVDIRYFEFSVIHRFTTLMQFYHYGVLSNGLSKVNAFLHFVPILALVKNRDDMTPNEYRRKMITASNNCRYAHLYSSIISAVTRLAVRGNDYCYYHRCLSPQWMNSCGGDQQTIKRRAHKFIIPHKRSILFSFSFLFSLLAKSMWFIDPCIQVLLYSIDVIWCLQLISIKP